MNNLYPPIIPTYMPAFNYASVCNVYFSLSPYNTTDEMNTHLVQVSVKHQNTNTNALNGSTYPNGIKLCQLLYDQGLEQYYIEIQPTDMQNNYFNIDEYYKVQIRFTSNEVTVVPDVCTDAWISANLQHFSEWSTVCLIQGISNVETSYTSGLVPYTSYENAKTRPYTEFSYPQITLVGTIDFSNSHSLNITEKDSIKHYTVRVLNVVDSGTPTELYNSGTIYVNHNDISNRIYYNIPYIFQEQTAYIIRVDVVTNFLYAFSNFFHVYIAENQNTLTADITSTLDNQNGIVTVNVSSEDASATGGKKIIIRRKSSKNNFTTWEDLYSFTNTAATLNKDFIDKTAEAGIWYYYGVQNEVNNIRSATISTDKPIMPYYDDIFLTANDQILRIRFDQFVDSFAITTVENKTETIGSKYPYVSKNGSIYYKSFNISGLIVSLMDDINGINASKEDIYKENNDKYEEFNEENEIDSYRDYIYERNFRDKVIEFLYKNQVKLFRSLTEGNILVKLMNISLTPKRELGRLLYSFSCNAVEIDEDSIKNDIKYGIYNNQE